MAGQSASIEGKEKVELNDKVRIAKENIPSSEGYKQSFKDEFFTIAKIAMFSPATYKLKDEGRRIGGIFS